MEEEKEVLAQDTSQNQSDPQLAQEQVESKSQADSENNSDHNWKEANKVLRMQKNMIDDLQYQLSDLKKNTQAKQEPDEFDSLDPEDYLKVGKAREFAEKIAEKKAVESAKKLVQEYIQQQTVENDEQKARSEYEDYDYVMENYAIPMIKNDPALAYKIQSSKNPAKTAYRLGKLSDDYQVGTMKQHVSPKSEKILKNASRPVSANAVGSPLKNQADQFAKMKSSEVWELSQKYARGA